MIHENYIALLWRTIMNIPFFLHEDLFRRLCARNEIIDRRDDQREIPFF